MEFTRTQEGVRRKSMELARNWSELMPEILTDIGKLVMNSKCVEDFTAFGGVCTTWRAAAKDVVAPPPWPVVPFLMLPEKPDSDEDKDEGEEEDEYEDREFYSLSKRKVSIRFPVPEAEGKRCIESRFGWLLTQEYFPGDQSSEVNLLNPFTGDCIQLPALRNLVQSNDHKEIERSVLSANPSETTEYVLVVLTEYYLAYWRPNEEIMIWTQIECLESVAYRLRMIDVNYYSRDNKFYSVDRDGAIRVWDPVQGGDAQLLLRFDTDVINIEYWNAYLAESSDGKLLLVTRNGQFLGGDNLFRYGATEFRVYEVDVMNRVVSEDPVRSLNEAIFVGQNAAFCLAPIEGVIDPGCIYFTEDSTTEFNFWLADRIEDCYIDSDIEDVEGNELRSEDEWEAGELDGRFGSGQDMGIYKIEDGSIRRFPQHVQAVTYACPPLWLAPSSLFHFESSL